MPTIREDVVFRQRIGELMRPGEAREVAQILGIDPQRLVAETVLIAARIDECGGLETGHAELLWLSSASSAQAGRNSETAHRSGNAKGPACFTYV
jgi:hypothetical protein